MYIQFQAPVRLPIPGVRGKQKAAFYASLCPAIRPQRPLPDPRSGALKASPLPPVVRRSALDLLFSSCRIAVESEVHK